MQIGSGRWVHTGLRAHGRNAYGRLRAPTGAYGRLRAHYGRLRALTGALRAQLLRAQLVTGLRAHLTGASPNVKIHCVVLTGAYGRTFLCVLYGRTLRAYGRTLRALTGAYGRKSVLYGRLRALTGAYGRKFLTGLRARLRCHLPGELCKCVDIETLAPQQRHWDSCTVRDRTFFS